MKLSYIVPIYNVEKYLCECVDSILSQTMDDFEIILVDDGSPDRCPQICDDYAAKYPDKIKVIHKKNGGLANARNFGLDAAVGDYIYFFDSDDYFLQDGIQLIYNAAVKSNADIVQSSYISKSENSGKTNKTVSSFQADRVYSRADMADKICRATRDFSVAFVWRNLYRRAFLLENNIRFADDLRMVEDSPFNIQAFTLAERFIAVDIPIYCYRLRNNSLQRQKYVEDYDKIIDRQWRLKLKYYEENCTPRREFYEDLGEYTVKAILPLLVRNIYINKIKGRYRLLRRIGNSEMLRRSFADYNIKSFRSKSLDWWMTCFIKLRLYPLAHLLCEKILYRPKKPR